jgi:hypothetical protein
MSINRKIITAAATLTIAAGVGAAATLPANAVTPSCGQSCVNFYSTALGHLHSPQLPPRIVE